MLWWWIGYGSFGVVVVILVVWLLWEFLWWRWFCGGGLVDDGGYGDGLCPQNYTGLMPL